MSKLSSHRINLLTRVFKIFCQIGHIHIFDILNSWCDKEHFGKQFIYNHLKIIDKKTTTILIITDVIQKGYWLYYTCTETSLLYKVVAWWYKSSLQHLEKTHKNPTCVISRFDLKYSAWRSRETKTNAAWSIPYLDITAIFVIRSQN